MRFEDIDRQLARSLRKQVAIGLLASVLLVAGFGGIAAYAEISGAVVGSGKVIVQGRTKQVQHPDGGIIGSIHVTEGERVKAGQTLFLLDGTRVQASLGVVESQLDQLVVQEARLVAELAGGERFETPPELSSRPPALVQALVTSQRDLMNARANTRQGRKAQLRENIKQLEEQKVAVAAQQQAVADNIKLLADQLANLDVLNAKDLVLDSQLVQARREMASLVGDQAGLSAQFHEASQGIALAELQITQVDEEFREALLNDLDLKRAEIARLREERIAALDRLDRLEIKSPINGFLHELAVHTIGGIVSPGETLVDVIPAEDEFLVEARLSPMDVDQVFPGQSARIRMTGFSQRVTPELLARINEVSADLTTDPNTGMSYYLATLSLAENELKKIGTNVLRPGMPAEVFIETPSRTVLSYMVKPISDQIQHAMREE